MPSVNAWIHFVWATKNRYPFFSTQEIRKNVFQHMKENAQRKNIYIDFINGYKEHVHCLISLGIDQNISKVMQLIKGESSFWINKNNICAGRFEWQEEYFACSISASHLNLVREYIKNQEEHHKKQTFQQEYDDFIASWRSEVLSLG